MRPLQKTKDGLLTLADHLPQEAAEALLELPGPLLRHEHHLFPGRLHLFGRPDQQHQYIWADREHEYLV